MVSDLLSRRNENRRYRREYKVLINRFDTTILKRRLDAVMTPDKNTDENNSYFIRSLYFDTYDNRAMREKIDGTPYRYKYRIRFYNHDPSFINLEKKIKNIGSTSKESARLTRDETEKIIAGEYGFLMQSPNDLKASFYRELTGMGLRPATVVDYTRYAYVYTHGNVRVTLDTDIRGPVGSIDIFDKYLPTVSIMQNGMNVLEVKFDGFLPDFIRGLVMTDSRFSSSMSKYVACRKYK